MEVPGAEGADPPAERARYSLTLKNDSAGPGAVPAAASGAPPPNAAAAARYWREVLFAITLFGWPVVLRNYGHKYYKELNIINFKLFINYNILNLKKRCIIF